MKFLKAALLMLCLVAGATFAHAQDRIADSLEKCLQKYPVSKVGERDTNRINLMNDLSFRCKGTGEYQKGFHYANEVIRIYSDSTKPMSHTDSMLLADAYSNKGLLYFRRGVNDSAVLMHKAAIALWIGTKNRIGYSMSLSHLAIVYEDEGNFPLALQYSFDALAVRDSVHDDKGVASIYGNIGEMYRKINDTAKAMEYHRKSLEVAERCAIKEPSDMNNKRVMGNALNNIGILYDNQKRFDQSLSYHHRALQIRLDLGDMAAVAASLNNIGSGFQELEKYDSAQLYYDSAFSIKRRIGDKRGMSICYLNLAGLSVIRKNYRQAKEYLDSSLYYCQLVGVPDLEVEIYRMYSDLYTASGDTQKAFDWYKKYISFRDSLQNDESMRQSMRAEIAYTIGKKAAADSTRIAEQAHVQDLENQQKIRQQKFYAIGGGIGFLLMLVVAVVSFRAYRQKQAANEIISHQKALVDEKQKEILDSINYAKKIQLTLLAHDELLQRNLGEHFVFFRPKDIVSGDFYWATRQDNRFYLAVCDSTGHGVPGAFMSLLNISFLNEAVNEKGISSPEEILNHVRARLINSVSKDGASDGMDGILTRFNFSDNSITYASAFNAPVIITGGQVHPLPADKMPVGKGVRENSFTLNAVPQSKGSMLYLYTDGFADQFGGPKGKKFKYSQLNSLLASIAEFTPEIQKQKLMEAFDTWKGNHEQVDDVCVIGIRL